MAASRSIQAKSQRRDRVGQFADENKQRIPSASGSSAHDYGKEGGFGDRGAQIRVNKGRLPGNREYTQAERDVEEIYKRKGRVLKADAQTVGKETADMLKHQKKNDREGKLGTYYRPGSVTERNRQPDPLSDHEFAALMLNRHEHYHLAQRPDLTPAQAGRLAKAIPQNYSEQSGFTTAEGLLQNQHLTPEAWTAVEANTPDAWEFRRHMLDNPTFPHAKAMADEWTAKAPPKNTSRNGYWSDGDEYRRTGEQLAKRKDLDKDTRKKVRAKLKWMDDNGIA